MSRIGRMPITIPNGVEINVDGQEVTVKGPKGTLSEIIVEPIKVVRNDDGSIGVERPDDDRRNRSLHGLSRTLINNMVVGVSEGYQKDLEIIGVGYKAANQGNILELSLGYSHAIILELPTEIKVSADTQKGKAPVVTLESYDKQLLGQVAAKIRSLRKPEPYKGKGIRFVGEEIRRKAGKSAGKK